MKVWMSCKVVSLPTLTLTAFTATSSATPEASSTGDGLGGRGSGDHLHGHLTPRDSFLLHAHHTWALAGEEL